MRAAVLCWLLLPGLAAAAPPAVEIALGSAHACARMGDGTVRCWGLNRAGQVGSGAGVDAARPVTVPGVRGALAVTAGTAHACALLGDGGARCWGDGRRGQLGDGERAERSGPVAVRGLGGAVEIRAGAAHTCARRAGGTVVCWGANDRGQLGDGTTEARLAPVEVAGLAHAVAISAGSGHSCALLEGGTVTCWGDNRAHEIDDGADLMRLHPTALSGWREVVQIAAGARLTCARAGRERRVVCRGGPIGFAPIRDDLPPAAALPEGATDLAVGSALGDETLHAEDSGGRHSFDACAVVAGGKVVCAGITTGGVALSRPAAIAAAPVAGVAGAVRVAVGAELACALLADGGVRCWGDNRHGELGIGTPDTRMEPTVVAGLPAGGVRALALGSTHSCALLADATVSCWGDDVSGVLGDGGGPARSEPRVVPGLSGVLEIAAGDYHTCARLGDGTVRCWGHDSAGQTSADPRTGSMAIATVPGLAGVTQIAAAGARSCARAGDGAVRCWGGPLPMTRNGSSVAPARVEGLGAALDLALGAHLGCVRQTAGAVRCWDDNSLDDRYQPTVARPVLVPPLAGSPMVSAGAAHVCGLDRERRPLCWGDPTFGALGPSRTLPWNVPGPLGDQPRVAQVVAGNHTNCTVDDGGHARCFGILPVELDSVAGLALGGTHACARMRDGGVRCWGANLAGQSGWGRPRDPQAVVQVSLD